MQDINVGVNHLSAVVYARVSSDQQTFGYSLQTQVEAARIYAEQRNYKLLAEFSDDYTGESLDRPSLDKLRDFVADNHVDVLLIFDVDRFARSVIYFMLLEEEFRRYGIRVEYVNDEYDDSDESQLQKQMRAAIAEYERKKIIERSKIGRRGKAKSGYVNVGARPPYGYKVKNEPHKQWLIVDDEEAIIVMMVFQWYLIGDSDRKPLSINGIAMRLTKMGIPTRGDKVAYVAKKQERYIWTGGMIRHILTCEAYTGVWYYGKTQIVKDETMPRRKPAKKHSLGTKQVARPREEWIAVPVPAIIDRETFEIAKDRLARNPRFAAGRPATRQYLLSKRLRCANCGYVLRGKTVKAYQYYFCNSQYKKLTDCKLPIFQLNLTDETIWNWLKSKLRHPDQIGTEIRQEQEVRLKATKLLQERLSIIEIC